MVNIPEPFANDLLNYFSTRPFGEVEIAVQNLRHFIQESQQNAQASLPFDKQQRMADPVPVPGSSTGADVSGG